MSKDDFFSTISYPSLGTSTSTTTTIATPEYSKTDISTTFTSPPPLTIRPATYAPAACTTVSACGSCQTNVAMNLQEKRPFVFLSCGHVMHLKCFADYLSKSTLPQDCDEKFGGVKVCVICLSNIPVGFQSDALHDRNEILREFRSGYSLKYGAYGGPADEEPLTPEQIRSILGVKLGMFSTDKLDYKSYGCSLGCKKPDEIIEELRQRNRTLEDIFGVQNISVHHLYKMGLTTMSDLVKLGYNSATHSKSAYRSKCPYWMLCDLFNFDKDDVFRNLTADSLLEIGFKPKELWLCGISMQSLVEHKLTKAGFCKYKASPVDIVRFLEPTHVHLNRIGMTRGDVSVEWNNAALTDAKIRAILAGVNK